MSSIDIEDLAARDHWTGGIEDSGTRERALRWLGWIGAGAVLAVMWAAIFLVGNVIVGLLR